jgi:hypothetical protein
MRRACRFSMFTKNVPPFSFKFEIASINLAFASAASQEALALESPGARKGLAGK